VQLAHRAPNPQRPPARPHSRPSPGAPPTTRRTKRRAPTARCPHATAPTAGRPRPRRAHLGRAAAAPLRRRASQRRERSDADAPAAPRCAHMCAHRAVPVLAHRPQRALHLPAPSRKTPRREPACGGRVRARRRGWESGEIYAGAGGRAGGGRGEARAFGRGAGRSWRGQLRRRTSSLSRLDRTQRRLPSQKPRQLQSGKSVSQPQAPSSAAV